MESVQVGQRGTERWWTDRPLIACIHFVSIAFQRVFRRGYHKLPITFVNRCLVAVGVACDFDHPSRRVASRQVETLLAPQLPLEGAILSTGGFADLGKLSTAELVYMKLTGGPVPGEWKPVKGDIATLVEKSAELLAERIATFDDESVPYTSRVAPYRADIAGDYDHLARVLEWSSSGWN